MLNFGFDLEFFTRKSSNNYILVPYFLTFCLRKMSLKHFQNSVVTKEKDLIRISLRSCIKLQMPIAIYEMFQCLILV